MRKPVTIHPEPPDILHEHYLLYVDFPVISQVGQGGTQLLWSILTRLAKPSITFFSFDSSSHLRGEGGLNTTLKKKLYGLEQPAL